MFGHDWQPAEGTIVAVHYSEAGNAAKTVNAVNYLVDVRPDSGSEPFRTEVEPPTLMLSFKFPHEGQVCRMEADVERKKARFDRTDPALSKKTDERAADAAYQALKNQRPDPPQPASDAGNADFLGGWSE
jgi:hypothetical protein